MMLGVVISLFCVFISWNMCNTARTESEGVNAFVFLFVSVIVTIGFAIGASL